MLDSFSAVQLGKIAGFAGIWRQWIVELKFKLMFAILVDDVVMIANKMKISLSSTDGAFAFGTHEVSSY